MTIRQKAIQWFTIKGIYAQIWGKSVMIRVNGLGVVISKDEIKYRAEMYDNKDF